MVKILLSLLLLFGLRPFALGKTPDFEQLVKDCQTKESPNCCLSSVETIKSGHFSLADKSGQCPKGSNRNLLKCINSYIWCEPAPTKCDALGSEMNVGHPSQANKLPACCDKLVRVMPKHLCKELIGGYYGGICVACGDHQCDSRFEDKCNCPTDCK